MCVLLFRRNIKIELCFVFKMEKVALPLETAQEPTEDACHPLITKTMSSQENKKRKPGITFSQDVQNTEISSSQGNSSYKDVLSQPAIGLPHKQKLLWLQKRRGPGLWVQCDDCDRWRFLPHVIDRFELPEKWFCSLNPDNTAADCSVPEATIRLRDEEDLIHSEYSAGSVVWARFGGWPWWPALVDDCPDTEQFYWLDGFSDIPTYYNVTFFDSCDVTRAWITPGNMRPYGRHRNSIKINQKFKKRIQEAMKQADTAARLPLAERLTKYCFLTRFKGNIGAPKVIKGRELQKFKNKLKRRLNIDFSDESDSDDSLQNEKERKKQAMKTKNVILVGTPKRSKHAEDQSREKSSDRVIEQTLIDEGITKQSDPPGIFKQPDSLVVQIGSNLSKDVPIDSDSSKTYVPENEADESKDASQETEMHVRVPTPSSDDFEF